MERDNKFLKTELKYLRENLEDKIIALKEILMKEKDHIIFLITEKDKKNDRFFKTIIGLFIGIYTVIILDILKS